MTTRGLLGHLERLRKCEESLERSDIGGSQPVPADYDPVSFIYFKSDPRWVEQHDEVKRLLATRDHVPRPAERQGRGRPKRKQS